MNKKLMGIALGTLLMASTLPALSACPCNPNPCNCNPCMSIGTTAGIVNYSKDLKRTNFGVIKKEKQLSEFEKLIKKAGLKDKIEEGNYTIFAPTNTAIKSMDQAMLADLKRPENKDKLVDFVMSHMAVGPSTAQCLCEQSKVTNLKCCQYSIDKCGNKLRIGSSTIIAPNVATKNGTVHVIDSVLQPYS